MEESEGRRETGGEPERKLSIERHHGSESEKSRRGQSGQQELRGARETEETAGEPGDGENEEDGAPAARTRESREKRERQNREDVLRRKREVRDSVVDRTEARRDQMRPRLPRKQNWGGERGSDGRSHARPLTKTPTPARATTAPAARSATRPEDHRWTSPRVMPTAWRHPVPITKPML